MRTSMRCNVFLYKIIVFSRICFSNVTELIRFALIRVKTNTIVLSNNVVGKWHMFALTSKTSFKYLKPSLIFMYLNNIYCSDFNITQTLT